ncbi:unnamed protein product [Victoria cruziana]
MSSSLDPFHRSCFVYEGALRNNYAQFPVLIFSIFLDCSQKGSSKRGGFQRNRRPASQRSDYIEEDKHPFRPSHTRFDYTGRRCFVQSE